MINEKPEARQLKNILQQYKNFWVWYGQEWFICFSHQHMVVGTNGKRSILLDEKDIENLEAIGIDLPYSKDHGPYSDNELISLALEVGFMLSRKHGTTKGKPSPVTDTKTILQFSRALLEGKRPLLELPGEVRK